MYRRREFIAGSLSLIAAPVVAQSDVTSLPVEQPASAWLLADILPGATVFVSADGDGDGVAEGSAAPIGAIGDLASRVAPGGIVRILGGSQPIVVEETIRVAAAGTLDAPVRIEGLRSDGTDGPVVLNGTRVLWPGAASEAEAVDAGDFGGNTLFRLEPGAGHIHFSNMRVEHFGSVLDLSGSEATNVVVEDVDFFNIRDGIYTDGSSSVTDLVLRRFSGQGFSKKAVRFHGTCSNWLIEDCVLDSRWQYGDNFAVGIEAHDQAHGLRVVGGSTKNCMDTQKGNAERYWNGDGIASERGNHDILIEGHHSSGHTDSGYDLKSESTELRNCVSEDNKRNYRLWGGIGSEPMLLTGCSSLNPRKRGGSGGTHHIWVSGASDVDDEAGSVLFVDGVIEGVEQEEAIHVDGSNAAIHLVDTVMPALKGTALFAATGKGSVLIVGSASDTGVQKILTPDRVDVIAAAAKSVELKADAEASWRLVGARGVGARVDGAALKLVGGDIDEAGTVVVQARDKAGRATQLSIATLSIANPVGEGAVLSLMIDGDGTVSDATGMHDIVPSSEAEVSDGAFHFRGKSSYFEVAGSENFGFDGPFWIETEFAIEDRDFALPADIVTVWKTSGNKRSFRLGLTENRAVAFFWSTDGRAQDGDMVIGPVLEAGQFYRVMVDRGDSGIVRLYVDGAFAAKSAAPVEALFAGNAPLRVAGRADGKQAAAGFMKVLNIAKGSARCDSDEGCVAS